MDLFSWSSNITRFEGIRRFLSKGKWHFIYILLFLLLVFVDCYLVQKWMLIVSPYDHPDSLTRPRKTRIAHLSCKFHLMLPYFLQVCLPSIHMCSQRKYDLFYLLLLMKLYIYSCSCCKCNGKFFSCDIISSKRVGTQYSFLSFLFIIPLFSC